MPMNEWVALLPAFASGVLIGTLFFGALLWTVRRGLASSQPAAWFFGSLLARMSIALTGFYLVGREHWQSWVLCLLGFVLARLIVGHVLQPKQAGYAP